MEISLNKEEYTETSEFVNFSIREYVAGIRKKDWKKCWPFGSLVFDSHQSEEESTFFSSQNCPGYINGSDDSPENKDAPNSSNVETCNGKDNRSETTPDMIESIGIDDDNGYPDFNSSKANKTQNRPEISSDGDEQGRNRPPRKHRRFRLLSDILRNLDTTETKDESDDITMDVLFRKEKGPMLQNKRMKIGDDQEPRFGNEEKSKTGFKDSFPCFKKVNRFTETAKEDSEMEAVMLLATHFNEENPSRPDQDCAKKPVDQEFATGMGCACVQKKIRSSSNESIPTCYISSKIAIKDPKLMKIAEHMCSMGGVFQIPVTDVCSINRNPADFSIPNAENVFMRGG